MMTDAQRERVQDIVRLVGAEPDRNAFLSLLERRLQGRDGLPDSELRQIAATTWREFLRNGWGPKSYSPEDSA
jgi:hypothetical protein